MDHAVSLVQAYLQLNGYFTSAEYPIIAGAGRNGFRTLTDIDILAFRFPAGLPIAVSHRREPQGLVVDEPVLDSLIGHILDKVVAHVERQDAARLERRIAVADRLAEKTFEP